MNLSSLSNLKRWLFMLSLALGIGLNAYAETIDGIVYTTSTSGSNRTATVTGYSGSPRNVVIPAQIKVGNTTYSVTSIADAAFANCTSLESISIPASVTSIGTTAKWSSSDMDGSYLPFYGCTALKSIVFEDGTANLILSWHNYNSTGVSRYNRGLFYSCPLEEVYIGRNIKYKQAYYSGSSYSFESYPQSYGYSAFYNQSNLTKVTIGKQVTSLPNYLFYKCSNLKSVQLGNKLQEIPAYCFSECDIALIDIPQGVNKIGEYAFDVNKNMITVKLTPSIRTISARAFSRCTSLKYIEFPEGLQTIGYGAFMETAIPIINIPSTVTTIGVNAFQSCKAKQVVIGNGTTDIGAYAFKGASSLEECIIGDKVSAINNETFCGCTKLKKLKIGSSVTTIADAAFANCTSLESISIPASVTSIGTTAKWSSSDMDGSYLPFYGCTALKSIVFEDGTANLILSWHNYNSTGVSRYNRGLFYSCPLEEVYIGRNIKYKQAYYSGSSYSFESYPQSYGYSAFYNQSNLTKVTVGEQVTSLPNYLFYGCKNLDKIISMASSVPTAGTSTFIGSTNPNTVVNATAYVPYGRKSSYSSANNWKDLKYIKEWFYDDNCSYIPLTASTAEVQAHPTNRPESIQIPATVYWSEGSFSVTAVADKGFENNTNLTTITLPESIKTVGDKAFYGCSKLSAVTFNGQTAIGDEAFRNCTSLINVSLPTGLKTIGDRAFQGANSITQIEFKDGIESIGAFSFMDCKALTAVRLPNTTKSIGTSAFENCIKLTYASVGDNLTSLGNSAFRNCSVLTEISIPGTTLTIGEKAFQNCKTLALATLNSGTTTIEGFCFDGCTELLSMTVPGTVRTIGGGSFNGCTALTSLTFGNSQYGIEIPQFTDSPLKTLRIGRNLKYTYSNTLSPFRDRTTLRRVLFTGDNVTNVYNYLLDGCSGITTISLPESLVTINEYAFRNCSSLPEITLPSALGRIDSHAFDGCSSIERLTINNSDKALSFGTDNSMFSDSPIKSLYVGRNLSYTVNSYTYPYEHAPFYQQKELTDLKFSEEGNITNIAAYFLYEAEKLPTLTLPEGITQINSYAFYKNSALTTVSLPSTLNKIGDYVFSEDNSIPTLTLPDNVTTVGQSTFRNCSAMESIHLSEKLSALNQYVLAGCTSLKSIIIPPSVTEILTGAFNDDTSLTDVTIGDSEKILTIGIGAQGKGMFHSNPLKNVYIGRNLRYTSDADNGFSPFKDLSTIQTVTFSQAGTITQILPYLLNGCSSVKNFLLPESLTFIGGYAFANMGSLESCIIPNNVTALGDGAFQNDSLLASVALSNRLPILNKDLFSNCVVLDNLSIPASVTEIKDNAFTKCTSMKNLRIENGTEVMSVGKGLNGATSMFRDCPLEKLHLGRWLTYDVNSYTYAPFEGRENLTELTLGETVGTIGKYLFRNCSALPEVVIPSGVESIGEQGFYNCRSLTRLTLGEGLTSLGEKAFARNISLDNVKMPSTLTAISDGCFSGCTGLVNLELNSGLEIIGPRAFENCSKLTSVDIPAKVYGLGVEAFQGCTSLSVVTIPEGAISSVGARAFKGCSNVGWISLGSNVTSLGVNCFEGCSKVGHIKSYNTVPPVGSPGFPQNVIDNGTVFVPADAVQDYKDSDTWWEFFQIRPITDGEFITAITLNQTEATIRDTETLSLSATTSPDNATDATVLFRSSDTSIATVDNTGLVSGKKPGDVVITAYAADGSGIYATCSVKVMPTLVERIEGQSEISIKVGRSMTCETTVYPENATDRSISWKSDNSSAVKVDENGTLIAVYDGTANVTATANDGSGVSFTFRVNVVPPTPGDSNDDDRVTISDAVNTANYAVGITPEVFVFRAADVNEDNRISLADASGTVAIVLDQPLQTSLMSKIQGLMSATNENFDMLVIDDYSAKIGETASVFVALDNTLDYVALQADVTVPEGMTLYAVNIGNRAEGNHSLAVRRIDERTMRIALFDINNSTFADNNEAILELIVKVNEAATGAIEINNILASDAQAHEYVLTSIGGNNYDMSGIDNVGISNIRIEPTADGINIYNAKGYEVAIYAVDGTTLAHFVASSDVESHKVVPGVYVVTVGNNTEKVMVK